MNGSGQYWNNGIVYLNRKNKFQIWPKVKNKIVSITDQLLTGPIPKIGTYLALVQLANELEFQQIVKYENLTNQGAAA